MRHPRILLLAACLAFATAATPANATPAGAPDQPSAASGAGALNLAAGTRPASVTGWYADPVTGALTVSVHGSADGVAEWAAGSGAGRVTVEHVATAPRPYWDLISGQLIYSGAARCTLGFNAYSGSVRPGQAEPTRFVLSAGHCTAGGGTSWYGVGGYIGPGAGSSFPTNDYGLIRVASPDAESTPLVDRYSAGGDVTITGAAGPTVGSSVCYSSPVGGWRCGTVTGVNQTVCYPEGCVYQLIRTNMCAEPGSSGAPVVTNPGSGSTVRAIGMVIGGSGNCTTGGTTWVQPIQEVLSVYGLTLYTG